MTPNDLPPSQTPAWIALGVQHAVLARTMPVVRHDLAGMLTIMRMGAVVLRRRVNDAAAPTGVTGTDPVAAQLEQLEEHLASLSESARRLRHWDLQGPQAPEPIAATAQLALQLAHPLLAMRGMQLALAPEATPLPATRAPQQPVLCLLLGAVHLLAEAPEGAPATVHLLPLADRPGSVRVQAEGHAQDAPPAAPTPGMPPLTGAALACLAHHVGATLRYGEGWVEIDMPPAPPAKAAPGAAAPQS